MTIDAGAGGKKMHYRELNQNIRSAVEDGFHHITIVNVSGQRFIGGGLKGGTTIDIYGDAGLDTGIFADGVRINVHGCSEYLLGNTMNSGEIAVYGDSWDITGMSARGGEIYVLGDGGCRVGMHMKSFADRKPTVVYGGRVKQYCGEYMAGGVIIVLGINYRTAVIDRKKPVTKENIDPEKVTEYKEPYVQAYLGCGMHGGTIYVRGVVPDTDLGIYAVKDEFTEADRAEITPCIKRFSELYNVPERRLWAKKYTKIRPISSRPFGKVYNSTPI